jgi:hypothetical protein
LSILAREDQLNSPKMIESEINDRIYVNDDDPQSDNADITEILTQFNH